MRRFALPAFYVAVGFALCWVVIQPRTERAREDRPSPPVESIDWRGEITVRRTRVAPAECYTPHSVHVDGHKIFAEPERADGQNVTLITLGGGRILIAATDAK